MDVILKLAPYLGRGFVILCSGLPIYWVYRAVESLAGKSTTASLGLTASLTVTGVAAAAKILADRRKMKEQSAELKRLRERCDALELKLLPGAKGPKVSGH